MDNNAPVTGTTKVTPVTVLVLGIVAAALSYNGVTIAGIIVGCIAAKKVKEYLSQNNGETCTMVMIGSILSKVGIYLGIGVTVIYAVYFAFYFIFILYSGYRHKRIPY
jgi:hypothetical protein